jgi:hypothetical protein
MPHVDVSTSNHGTLIGFDLRTPAARSWASENLPEDASCLGSIVYAEPRYATVIITGMQDDGLVVT